MLDFPAHLLLPRLLLIDDDMVSREVTATVLTLGGYTVHTAADGEAALALLDAGESDPEVILMDTQMPGLSGVRLMDALRARSRAKVFAISGSEAPDDVAAAADGFLLKPFGSDGLRTALNNYSPRRRPAPEITNDADAPVLKPETLASFRDSMAEDKVREIYTSMVADLHRRIASLDAAVASHDAAEVRRIGHSIKGGCAMAGAARISRLGALIELAKFDPGSDQVDNTAQLVNDLRSEVAELERMLKAEFSG
jgi:CheY-like chemotaxis protein/HPt (histidine-containing phosphotransfer) domain-containing protein